MVGVDPNTAAMGVWDPPAYADIGNFLEKTGDASPVEPKRLDRWWDCKTTLAPS